ncbi:MAG: type II secretion system F family protein [Armatimonadota bacterium]
MSLSYRDDTWAKTHSHGYTTKQGSSGGLRLWDRAAVRTHSVQATRELVDTAEKPRLHGLRAGKPSADEMASVVRQLSILVRAGVPLVESLQSLAEQARSQLLRVCLDSMAKDVSYGMALSDAFARQQIVFPALAVEMARVAEAGGNLAETLDKLATHLETSAEISRKVKSALAYPVVVLAISVITVVVMVSFILPRFIKLFNQMGAKLPWTTKMLMGVSHSITGNWYLFVGGVVGAVYLARRYMRSEHGRRKVDALMLRVPVVGDIVQKVVLGRVLGTMSTLLASGVPMVKALETAALAANNAIVRQALMDVRQKVAEGTATSQALRDVRVFPPVVLQMVASGEKTGDLPTMLEHVRSLYALETDAKVKALTSIIEPVMIVVLGLIVGFIAMSVIVPIYSLVGGVK